MTARYVTVWVSTELLDHMLEQWSPPVEVKIIETSGVGTGYELIARTVEPRWWWRLRRKITKP